MQNLDFQNIGMVLADSNRMVRRGLCGALHAQGFRDIVDTDRVSGVREAIADSAADLLVCDAHLRDGDSLKLTHDIRHNRVGRNPFIVIITFVDSPERNTIARVMNSGSDDIVLKPISANTLLDRIVHLVSERKNFVVTSDYIGPNRRGGGRNGGMAIAEIGVPNSVRIKAMREGSVEEIQRAIDRVASDINEEKLRRHAFQIGYLVGHILPAYKEGAARTCAVEHLDRLLFVTEDIGRRLVGTPFAHVGELCESLLGVADNIRRKSYEPDPQDLKLLPQLAQAVERAFNPADRSAAVARDISQTVKERVN